MTLNTERDGPSSLSWPSDTNSESLYADDVWKSHVWYYRVKKFNLKEVKSLNCAAEMMHRLVELLAVAAQRKK